jgi:GNAT superfamily N-acetyltransferase
LRARRPVRIRAAEAEDAPAIGGVHVEAWRSAYRGIVPEAHLAGLSPVERASEWRDLLAHRGGARFVFVAHDEGDELIGFAAAGPERSGDPLYRGELYALYVLASHQRRGVGRALVRAAAGRLASGGMGSVLLWVLQANGPARRFYEALGGWVVREQPIEIGGVTFTEVAYGWPDLQVLLKAAGLQPSAPAA